MTLREFCRLDILCEDDPIHLVSMNGSYMNILDFDNQCRVGTAENYLKAEVLDKEVACITPSGDAFLVYFKED